MMEAAGRLLRVAYNGALIPLRAAFTVYALNGRARGLDRREFQERLGWIEKPAPRSLWIQAASVGEVSVALALAQGLRGMEPALPVLLTTTTRTGQALARKSSGAMTSTAFFPLDFPSAVHRALDRLEPAGLVLIETEVWPNLLLAAARRGVPVFVANGRISDRAFRRYMMIAPLIRSALRDVRCVCAQSDLDANRFEQLGVRRTAIQVTGNMKFSTARSESPAPPSDSQLVALLGLRAEDELWIGASTAPGEEEAVLAGFEGLPPPARGRRVLVLAPRHADRFEEVGRMLTAHGCPWVKRTALAGNDPGAGDGSSARIVLLDTLGELSSLFSRATVVFVGGSLVPVGGHNMIEPASRGVAPIFGPHVQNFRDASRKLLEAGGAFQVHDRAELVSLFHRLATDPSQRTAKGAKARAVVVENAGALDATVRAIRAHLQACGAEAR